MKIFKFSTSPISFCFLIIDKFFDESQNDEASAARAEKSFAQTYRDKNLDGRDDINGFNKLPRDMTPPKSRDAFSNLIADGRFLNGNGLIISEGIRASSGSGSANGRIG